MIHPFTKKSVGIKILRRLAGLNHGLARGRAPPLEGLAVGQRGRVPARGRRRRHGPAATPPAAAAAAEVLAEHPQPRAALRFGSTICGHLGQREEVRGF